MANQSHPRPAKRSGGINANFLGAVVLGICILVAGLNIGGNIKKLNKTVTETEFASSTNFTVPSDMGIEQKKYMTESEAGEYLNLSTEKIISLITSGEISEYVRTENGYSISVSVLDAWFDNEAYQTKLKYNAAAEPSGSTGDGEDAAE